MDELEVRARFVTEARQIAGLSFGLPTRAAYLDLIAPAALDPTELRDRYGALWSCALVVLGLWRRAGVVHDLLERAYVPGAAMTWVGEIAASHQATVYPDGRALPGLGDAIEVAAGQHVVAALVGRQGRAVETIEGGQLDGHGNKAVLLFHRRLVYLDRFLMLDGSRVLRWHDCAKLLP